MSLSLGNMATGQFSQGDMIAAVIIYAVPFGGGRQDREDFTIFDARLLPEWRSSGQWR